MAPLKRKRNPTKATSNSRQKTAPSASTSEDDQFYEAVGILKERCRNGRIEYLVDWAPDPLTQKVYEPDWQPRENCTERLVADWQQRDVQCKSAKKRIRSPGTRGKNNNQLPLQPPPPPPPPPRSKRKSRVVESSPLASSTSASLPSPPTAQPTQSQTPAPTSPARPRESPQVHVEKRKSPASSFKYYSQLPASPASSVSSARHSFLSSQSSYTGPREYLSSGIVYDSEEDDAVNEGASYVPTTQDASTSAGASTQQQLSSASKVTSLTCQGTKTCANALQEYTAFSPLFEREPTSPALSIPISIPETEPDVPEYDTIEDSQVQQSQCSPVDSSQTGKVREIPESVDTDTIVSTSQPALQGVVGKEQPTVVEDIELALNEEEASLIAEEEASLAATEKPPTVTQESEITKQSTLLQSTEEPFETVAQIEEQVQITVPASPEVPAASESEPTRPSEGQPDVTEQKELELELGPPRTEISEDTRASPQDFSQQRLPSAVPLSQEEQISAEHHLSEQPTLPPTTITATSAAVPEQIAVHHLTNPETVFIPVQSAPGLEVTEHNRVASLVPNIVQSRQQSPQPDTTEERPLVLPARETQHHSQSALWDTVVQTNQAPKPLIHNSIEHEDFALPSSHNSSCPQSAANPTPSQQHAQHVPTDAYLSTQDDVPESVRTTVEKVEFEPQDQTRSQSRHDSSQESPEPFNSSAPVSSPLPLPPSHSFGTLASNAPPRPRTPAYSSQSLRLSSIMGSSGEDTMTPGAREIKAELQALYEKRSKENPFIPKRNLKRSRMLPHTGTRSPSTIPDRSPMPQVPTSLRTVAVSNSMAEPLVAMEAGPSEPAPIQEEGESTSDSNNVTTSVPVAPASTDDELSDADDASVLNDDLQLQHQEFIVPLPIDGRQVSMYRDELKNNQEILKAFMVDPETFEPIDKVDRVVQRLQAIETHIDLVFSASQPSQEIGSSTQLQHQAQWSFDNSIKFRFIGTLLHRLQDRDMHVLLVLEKDDARLFDMVENFFRGRFINFKSPTRGHQADAARVEGNVMVTILLRNSSPIVRPPHLIICLDGHVDAGEIRKKNWAANPDLAVVPLLHLVIPRTVDHIVRYTSPVLNNRRRLHTIFATLAQLHAQGEIGRAMSHTLMPSEAANEIVQFLMPSEDSGSPVEWPLPSIGSIKDVIEYQTQQSQQSIASPPRGAPVAAKRPLEDDMLDPAKRMRFTPQPGEPTSSVNDEHEITHVSDSMPGTAVNNPKAQQQLAEALHEIKRLRDRETSWSKQQVAHEERGRAFVKTKVETEELHKKIEASSARETVLRDRLETRTTEYRDLQARHKALEDIKLLSTEEQIAEITRLRKDLETAQDASARALKSKQTAEESFEYVKEQYRAAQDAATTFRDERDDALSKIEVLTKQASGEVRGLAQLHYDRQDKAREDRETQLLIELKNTKQLNAALTEEVTRLKNGRGVGVGTRAQTISRPGSRAASPVVGTGVGGYRDRLANLRHG